MSYRGELQRMFDLQKFGMKFGLDGMAGILEKLGNPHRKTKFVHLAGTNGKGSVGVMLQSILCEAGFRVGLYTSPHLITFRERIKIGREMISEDEVLDLSRRIWPAAAPQRGDAPPQFSGGLSVSAGNELDDHLTAQDSPPTFFEFVTAMAFLYFAEKEVDLAIIETGLGGRLDSTNVITPLISAITNISLEHTEHLGDTIEAIAAEKAGIIKAEVPVAVGPLLEAARQVVLDKAAGLNSPVIMPGRDYVRDVVSIDDLGRPLIDYRQGFFKLNGLQVGLSGPHQADNAALALSLLPSLAARGFAADEGQIRRGLAAASWPGRAEIFSAGAWPPEGPPAKAPLLLDGAHNPAGAAALAKLLEIFSGRRIHLIVGVMADKDISGVLGPLLKEADRLYLTRPAFSRAATPGLLWDKIAAAFGSPEIPVSLHLTIPEAFKAAAAAAGADDLVVLSGSLFTVGEGRAYLHGLSEVESN